MEARKCRREVSSAARAGWGISKKPVFQVSPLVMQRPSISTCRAALLEVEGRAGTALAGLRHATAMSR